MADPIVIVGAGLAGARAAEAIREQGHAGPVLLLGAEPSWPYQRPALSKEVLTGPAPSLPELWLQPEAFYRDQRIEVRRGVAATALALAQRRLSLTTGEQLSWDRLIIATGSTPRMLEVPGAALPGVRTLRTWEDALAARELMKPGARVVVVGGGLLGLEVASAAITNGATVTLLERGRALLSRCVGSLVGASLVPFVQASGVKVRLHARVARVVGTHRAEAVVTEDGEVHDADLVVVALGVRPTTDWLEGSGLELGDGVKVDSFGRTSAPGVFAAGDVASVWSPALERYVRAESYAFAAEHGFAVGQNVLSEMKQARPVCPSLSRTDRKSAPVSSDRPDWSLSRPLIPTHSGGTTLFGRRLQFSGDHRAEETCHVFGEPGTGSFVALLGREGRLTGRVALGQPQTFRALAPYVGQPIGRAVELLARPTATVMPG